MTFSKAEISRIRTCLEQTARGRSQRRFTGFSGRFRKVNSKSQEGRINREAPRLNSESDYCGPLSAFSPRQLGNIRLQTYSVDQETFQDETQDSNKNSKTSEFLLLSESEDYFSGSAIRRRLGGREGPGRSRVWDREGDKVGRANLTLCQQQFVHLRVQIEFVRWGERVGLSQLESRPAV